MSWSVLKHFKCSIFSDENLALREKCPNMEFFFLVRISLYSTEFEDLLLNLRIQSEYMKIQTRNNSVFVHVSRSLAISFY